MENEFIPLSIDDTFAFSCNRQVTCFNECCRDLNQFLTPYDILRLKTHLGLPSDQFLTRYTAQHTGPDTGLPVVTLRPGPDLQCPFVTPDGCSVYPDRPSSCRIYPIARAITRSRETGRITEHFALLKESHCKGFATEKTQSVREWIASQGLADYFALNDEMMEIISLKNQLRPGPLDLAAARLFHLGCYDLDGFKAQILDTGRLESMNPDPALVRAALTDDKALLKLSLWWVKTSLFGSAGRPAE